MYDLARALGPIYRRVMLIVGRGTLTMTDDGNGQQRQQVTLLDGETRDAADRVQQYGLSSHPPAGSQVVVINLGGQRDHPIVIGVDDPSARPTGLASGEVMLWTAHGQRVHLQGDGGTLITDAQGHRIHLKPGGDVDVECVNLSVTASGGVAMDTPALTVTGEISDGSGQSMAQMRAIYNAHQHPGHAPVPPVGQMA